MIFIVYHPDHVLKTIQNPLKFKKHVICGQRKLGEKSRRSTFVESKQLSEKTFEVQELITNIKEVYPIHIGNAILHLSKLLLVKFITFLERYLVEDSFRLIYTGKHNLKTKITFKLRHRFGCDCHGRRDGQLRQTESL